MVVVKIGGGTLAHPAHLDSALAVIGSAAARGRSLLVVPGGGPFADAVREADRRLQLTGDAAHWMAVLAMDQFAHLIAARMPAARLVAGRDEIDGARPRADLRVVPVLAPYRWLRGTDPLPHSWDVTSDSIAAWVAGQMEARRLVLVKPAGVEPNRAAGELTDGYFARALPPDVESVIVPVDRPELLAALLEA